MAGSGKPDDGSQEAKRPDMLKAISNKQQARGKRLKAKLITHKPGMQRLK